MSFQKTWLGQDRADTPSSRGMGGRKGSQALGKPTAPRGRAHESLRLGKNLNLWGAAGVGGCSAAWRLWAAVPRPDETLVVAAPLGNQQAAGGLGLA